jgi:hypothetical protein
VSHPYRRADKQSRITRARLEERLQRSLLFLITTSLIYRYCRHALVRSSYGKSATFAASPSFISRNPSANSSSLKRWVITGSGSTMPVVMRACV